MKAPIAINSIEIIVFTFTFSPKKTAPNTIVNIGKLNANRDVIIGFVFFNPVKPAQTAPKITTAIRIICL